MKIGRLIKSIRRGHAHTRARAHTHTHTHTHVSYCGAMSEPCCIIEPQLCQMQLLMVRLVSR